MTGMYKWIYRYPSQCIVSDKSNKRPIQENILDNCFFFSSLQHSHDLKKKKKRHCSAVLRYCQREKWMH